MRVLATPGAVDASCISFSNYTHSLHSTSREGDTFDLGSSDLFIRLDQLTSLQLGPGAMF